MSEAVRRFLPLLDEVAKDFCQMMQTKVEREGRGERGKRSLTIDPSPDLFRFALEGLRPSGEICDLLRWGSDGGAPPLMSQCPVFTFDLEVGQRARGSAYNSFSSSALRSLLLTQKR